MISIITPCYNRANLIPHMISSILKQTYIYWELIIVDDGSTDNTQQVIKEYLKDDRIKYYKKPNTGAADSRNYGVQYSTEKFITFLDSDDIVKPSWLEIFSEFINDENFGFGSIGFENRREDFIINTYLPKNLGPLFGNQIGSLAAGSFILNKNCFESVNGYDIDLESGQHTELLMRIIPCCLKKKLTILYSMDVMLQIYHHKGDRIRTNHLAVFNGTKRILEKHHANFLNSPKDLSNYYGILGYRSSKLNKKHQVNTYFWKSFKTFPTIKGIARLLKYNLMFKYFL